MSPAFEVQRSFFDSAAVTAKLPAAKRRALSKSGAYVRQEARSKLRKRKRPSRPGEPPSMQQGLIKKFLYFSYDATRDDVVTGPELLRSRIKPGRPRPVGNTTPGTLEHGSPLLIFQNGEPKTVTVEPRPFMAPALAKVAPQLPELWRNTISN